MAFSVSAIAGIIVQVTVDLAEAGWLVLAGIMIVISLVSVPAARWALASRGRYSVTTHSG